MATSPPAPEDVLPPTPSKVVSRRGDLWQLGKHRLLCGDAREAGNFARLMDGTRAAAVFCDPPYNLRVSNIGGRGKIQHPEFAFASGEMNPAEYRKFLLQTLRNGARVSAGGAVHFACMDWRHIADLVEVGRGLYGAMLNLVVWNKTNSGQGSFYRSQHELIGVFRVGEESHRNNVTLALAVREGYALRRHDRSLSPGKLRSCGLSAKRTGGSKATAGPRVARAGLVGTCAALAESSRNCRATAKQTCDFRRARRYLVRRALGERVTHCCCDAGSRA
jgi:hypothetical protein